MPSLFSRFFSRPALLAAVWEPPAPAGIISVVGDVHGCDHLLARLLPRLPGQVVLVGDLIDRGERSAAVIDLVMGRPDILCLMGNHEAMLLGFLDDPAGQGPRWLRYGGLQTLASYGLGGDLSTTGLPRLRDRLAQTLGDERIAWLRALPPLWRSGTLAVTHAGADPARPIENQEMRHLLWGHPDCGQRHRTDAIWLAHGHTVVETPYAAAGVIAVDTGAYATGRLTAAIIGEGPVRFEAT